MTKKSVFGFGKHATDTVAVVMALDRTYIPFAYYNLELVSFCDEILDELGIIRIEKPGVSDEVWKQYRIQEKSRFTEEERLHGWFRHKQVEKLVARARAARVARYTRFTKGQLQAINHGKM